MFPRRAVLRETAEKKRFLEIWIGDVLEGSKDVTKSHGSFYSDGTFLITVNSTATMKTSYRIFLCPLILTFRDGSHVHRRGQ